ncbi:MAG: aminoacyl-histidine dipeptidase [Gammaproteobacteria bacterium]|jgi:dipeptidase D
MNAKDINNLEPKQLWQNFAKLCEIPRPSHHEEKISAFMKNFGKELGLETHVNKLGNVIIKKSATAGMENRKTVVLQAHLDMVPEKNNDIQHDFTKDPIEAYIDGDVVTAKGTTLGADDGIGVATIMTILQSKDIKHGPIEALFTINEEDGMDGAFAVKPDELNGEILLNLDSELEGEINIACAGGIYTNATIPYTTETSPSNAQAYQIIVTGLSGGHSGIDIHLERGNAIKIMNQLLWEANNTCDIRVANFDGGSAPNAIPREAHATIIVAKKDQDKFLKFIDEFTKTIKNELAKKDDNLTIQTSNSSMPEKVFTKESLEKICKAIYTCPNGVFTMSADIPGLTETSTNIGIIKTTDKNIEIYTLQRSSTESLKEKIAEMVTIALESTGGTAKRAGSYPAWQPNTESEILKLAEKIYKKLFNKEVKVTAMHAGLEPAILGHTFPNWDMISIGPTLRFVHSPDEKAEIATVDKFWKFLLEILLEIPKK